MNCHFKSSDRCPPHARMILAELNITQAVEHGSIEYVCHCGFDKGLFVCLERMLVTINSKLAHLATHTYPIMTFTVWLVNFEVVRFEALATSSTVSYHVHTVAYM